MKRILGLSFVLIFIFTLASFAIYAEDHHVPTPKMDEETLKRVEDEVRELIIDAYSEHYEINNLNIQEVFNDPSLKENEVLVMVSFETKSRHKTFTDYPFISGAYKALSIDKRFTERDEIIEAIIKTNPQISKDLATEISDNLVSLKPDLDLSRNESNSINLILKITLGTQELAYEFQELHSKRYGDVSEIFPKPYKELEEEGFDTIVSIVGASKLANDGIMPHSDDVESENKDELGKPDSNLPLFFILIYTISIFTILF